MSVIINTLYIYLHVHVVHVHSKCICVHLHYSTLYMYKIINTVYYSHMYLSSTLSVTDSLSVIKYMLALSHSLNLKRAPYNSGAGLEIEIQEKEYCKLIVMECHN